jgi:hypothetical protein
VAHTFGNEGGLYRRAMVWWDHETESLWAQPTGTGLSGEYAGVRLEAVPAAIQSWVEEHPDTVVLVEDQRGQQLRGSGNPFQRVSRRFVGGVTLGEDSRAYHVEAVAKVTVLNDALADVPLLIYTSPDRQVTHVYARQVDGEAIEFEWVDGQLRDVETGSTWAVGRGLATAGPLAGTVLRQVPFSTAFDWAWELHNPRTTFYPGR